MAKSMHTFKQVGPSIGKHSESKVSYKEHEESAFVVLRNYY